MGRFAGALAGRSGSEPGTLDGDDLVDAPDAFVEGLAVEVALSGTNGILLGEDFQNEDLVASYNLPDYNVKRYNSINELMFRVAYQYADSDSLPDRLQEAYDKWAAVDSIYFSTLGVEFDHFRYSIYMYNTYISQKNYH